ncbi:MAG: lysine--tRNA ligase [Nanoarchaeota archaeon]|nr:lysine--tRNA ligase [Nanoarchaeota archaeon]
MQELFWAEKLAKTIITRERFKYSDRPMPKFSKYIVKTSASLSGVLHIGRLSDTIRGSTVHQALEQAGKKAELIWVAEDMDPLRKVPKGMPKEYEKYLGMPVTSVPDPEGKYKSYADRHRDEYLKVIDQFIFSKMKKYSMMQEYDKGSFRPYIKAIMEKVREVREIQDKYRKDPLPEDYSPWKPICRGCGKIATPRIKHFDGKKVTYVCEDYSFEKTTAKGCGHEAEADPLKDKGKLMWKSEWAAQWAHWKVVSEGAGKEYQVPNSAWWVNAEICEKVLDFPMPEPIFYEHLMIDGVKMSASLGNVVYPSQWLQVATPDMLRLLYNKRLMTTRSFSWKELPLLYEDFDRTQRIASGEQKLDNEKEVEHYKKLHSYSAGRPMKPLPMAFYHAQMLVQFYDKEEDMISSLKKTGHYDPKRKEEFLERLGKVRVWLDKFAPEEAKFKLQEDVKGLELSEGQKKAIKLLTNDLDKKWDEKTLFERFYKICEEAGIKNTEFFKGCYQVLLRQDRGPKLAPFILVLGKDRVKRLFGQV